MRLVDLTGNRFGRLVVIDRAENKHKQPAWNCACDCGNKCVVSGYLLRSGITRSCGCLRRETAVRNGKTVTKYNSPLERKYKNQQARRLRDKDWLYQQKKPCAKCGENRPYAIDFHHINPSEKSFQISGMVREKSRESILAEIQKCVCLCKNCHAEFHYLYGRQPDKPVKSLTEYLGRSPYEV